MSLAPPPPTGNGLLDRWLALLFALVKSGSGADLASASIGDIGDVTITSPANGDVLTFDGSFWVNSPPTGGSGGAVSNVISANMTIAQDTSYIVSSYIDIQADLTINGILEII